MLPLLGTVVRDAELRASAAGKPWMSVIVRYGDGDAASFVQVTIFGDAPLRSGSVDGKVRWTFQRRFSLLIRSSSS